MGCSMQDVVLYAHGQLSWGKKLWVGYHLSRCISCNTQLGRHASVAKILSQMSGTRRDNPIQSGPKPSPAEPLEFWKLGVMALIGTSLLLGGAQGYQYLAENHYLPWTKGAVCGQPVGQQPSAKP
jgi:hypothetical protein